MGSNMHSLQFLIVGCGSIAKRHLKNLLAIGVPKEHIGLCDINPARVKELRDLGGLPESNGWTSLSEALSQKKQDAALICAPTAFHTQVGMEVAKAGAHLFMEKPIAADQKNLDQLLSLVSDNQLVFAVAYFFRFHPGFKKVKEWLDAGKIGPVYGARVQCGQYLPDWHPWEDYRGFYMSKKNEGGGALLDISHELDYLKAFMNSKVSEVACFYDTLGPLEMDADNMSSTILKFENGAIASLQLDLLQRVVRRNCELIGQEGTIVWDHPSKTVTLFTPENKAGEIYKYDYDGNQGYIDELKHFVQCIQDKKRPIVDGVSGAETLKIITAAKRSSEERKFVRLDK